MITGSEACDDGNTVTESCAYGETACTVCDATCNEVPGATSFCGDDVTDTANGETCDTAGESLTCDDDCTAVECGDGTINATAGEDCEDGALGGATCQSEGFFTGDLACTSCQFQYAACSNCGDGAVQTAEGEQCDDGGESANCNADCTVSACGDGVLNITDGEACDEGTDNTNEGNCTLACELPICGDGFVWNEGDGDEFCDVGPTDACNVCFVDASGPVGPIRWVGQGDQDYAGYTVDARGDVDGDGKADVLVGTGGPSDINRAYLIFGDTISGQAPGSQQNLISADCVIEGDAVNLSGFVAFAGDVDGDDRDDLLIEGSNGTSLVLAADLIGNCGIPLSLQSFAAFTFSDRRAFAAGDVDGDGKADIGFDPDPGTLSVVLGRDIMARTPFGMDSAFALPTEASFVVPGLGVLELAAAGDVDGDGKDDLVGSGEPSLGSRLVPGASLTTPLISAAVEIDSTDVITLVCDEGAFDYCDGGWTGIGDVDGDGLDDLWGEIWDNGTANPTVPVRRIPGSALASLAVGTSVDVSTLGNLSGPCGDISAHGDVDGDGLSDVTTIDSLVRGSTITAAPAGTELTCDDVDLDARFISELDFAGSRRGIVLGDVNGDGRDDLVVPEPLWQSGSLLYGRVSIILSPY